MKKKQLVYYKKLVIVFCIFIMFSTPSVFAITKEKINHPPDAPKITGPDVIYIGETYEFTFKAVDPDGNDVLYEIKWGDGTSKDWFGPFESGEEITVVHTFRHDFYFAVKARAKDIYGCIGDWGYYKWNHSRCTQKSVPNTILHNGSLLGYVNDTKEDTIEGALVRVHFHGTYEEDYSDSTGFYHVTNIPICYCMKNTSCSKNGYKTEWVLLSIAENTTHDFVLATGNNPPDKPDIYGPIRGRPGIEYHYSFKTIDPEDDNVSYFIEWGDGTNTGWTDYYPSDTMITFSHIWDEIDRYPLRCKAKDIHGDESDWSTFPIEIPRNKLIYLNLLGRLFEKLPYMEVFLRIIRS
jgi:hypothetical protein